MQQIDWLSYEYSIMTKQPIFKVTKVRPPLSKLLKRPPKKQQEPMETFGRFTTDDNDKLQEAPLRKSIIVSQ
jgi:hypothetical protein